MSKYPATDNIEYQGSNMSKRLSVFLLLQAELLYAQRIDFNKRSRVGGAEAFK